ncbi:unnamed protein product [Rhodiola kirilowii]
MRCLSWNCQGLGRPRTVCALKEIIRVKSPQILGIIETKKRDKDFNRLKYGLGFQNCFAVSSCGKARGLAVLWDDSIDLRVIGYSQRHIDVVVKDHQEV